MRPAGGRHSDRETGRQGDRAKKPVAFFFFALVLSSCHHRIPDPRIRLEVSPPILKPGTVVSGKVFVDAPAREVWGRAEVLGSPRYRLRWDETESCWRLKGQVPYGAPYRPGRYFLRVEVRFEDGSKGRAWAEVELR